MEFAPFLGGPQNYIKIMSWNINSVKTKTEKGNVLAMLNSYDIVCLCEVKTALQVSIPGFVCYSSVDQTSAHRGGVCVFIKVHLCQYVSEVDTSMRDQVWLKMQCTPGVLFGFCYVPPSDSPYFDFSLFSNIQNKVKSRKYGNSCVILGDLNARFGEAVSELPVALGLEQCSYPDVPDQIRAPNDNASALLGVCVEENLLLLNNLKSGNKHFPSKLTFRQGMEFVSELDLCVVSPDLIEYVEEFNVIQDMSLPSDHAPITVTMQPPSCNLNHLYDRASELGGHAVLNVRTQGNLVEKPIKFDRINHDCLSGILSQLEPPPFNDDVDDFALSIRDALYKCAFDAKGEHRTPIYDEELSRWDRLLSSGDETCIWRSINWSGEVFSNDNRQSTPTDTDFKDYLEQTLNPTDNEEPDDNTIHTDVYMPILDDPITEHEVCVQIGKLKSNKACGPDGLAPGIFKLLPVNWILCITTLFNAMFTSGVYPQSWMSAKMNMIFKRGSRAIVSNYRGISVINSLSKVYDMILCDRLSKWFQPYREQAGAQAGRGCTEHIVSLRLLTDLAKRKKFKLFVVFIDFSQAYDRVRRNILFTSLKSLGCGMLMLCAIVAMYKVTNCIVGTALFSTSIGVRQGSPTSCLLFILYVNDLIRLIKQNCGWDGFLGWLHILALMDDTILLATSRHSAIEKFKLLNRYCDTHGMKVNMTKTKFFAVNGDNDDKQPIKVDDIVIESCDRYVYLGSPFSADGSVSTAIKIHAENKLCHVLKFVAFVHKNNDAPFNVKLKVFHAALMSTLLYGCESWLGGDLRPVNKLYMWCVKQLLEVRKTTCNDLCLLELGLPPLRALVASKQRKYFSNTWYERRYLDDDPLVHSINTVLSYNYHTARYVRDLLYNNINDVQIAMNNLKQKVLNSESSRYQLYCVLNPNLDIHDIYATRTKIVENHRISWTRIRVSGHSLAVEEGRWNRRGRGRLPLEERLCVCGEIQSERHVIEQCPQSAELRQQYRITTMENLLVERDDYEVVCGVIHSVLSLYA